VRQLQARVALIHAVEPDQWPDFSDATLRATLDDWLTPHLAGLRSLAEARALDLALILRGLLGWTLLPRLDRELPKVLDLPGGSIRIDYTTPVPVAAARAHMFYGLDETPKLAAGRVPLQLSLLSPAGRPIAITADLHSFWRRGWADTRSDMRGRYPKHDWPEEPWLNVWRKNKRGLLLPGAPKPRLSLMQRQRAPRNYRWHL